MREVPRNLISTQVVAVQAERESPVHERVARGPGPHGKREERWRRVGPDDLHLLGEAVGMIIRRRLVGQRRQGRVDLCANQPVSRVHRQFFAKSFLGDNAAVLAGASGKRPQTARHRAGVASMAWRS